MKLCHTCQVNNVIYSNKGDPDEAEWAKKMKVKLVPVTEPPNKCKNYHPEAADLELTLTQNDIPEKTKIFYWAAEPVKLKDSKKILRAPKAYNRTDGKKPTNTGCTTVKKGGVIVFKIKSPRCYMEGKTVWPKHIHFVKGEKTEWNLKNVYTILGLPVEERNLKSKKLREGNVYVTPRSVIPVWKKKDCTLVFALGKRYNSLHNLEEYKNLKHIELDYQKKKIEVPKKVSKKEPLVVYCANKTCDASKSLIVKLVDLGYENIYYMDAGMEGFSKKSKEIFAQSVEKKMNTRSPVKYMKAKRDMFPQSLSNGSR